MRLVGAIAIVLISAPPALAAEMPSRKAGLWDIKMGITGGGVPTMAVQHCTDAATDKDLRTLYSPMSKDVCTTQDVAKTATGYTASRICKHGDDTTTTLSREICERVSKPTAVSESWTMLA